MGASDTKERGEIVPVTFTSFSLLKRPNNIFVTLFFFSNFPLNLFELFWDSVETSDAALSLLLLSASSAIAETLMYDDDDDDDDDNNDNDDDNGDDDDDDDDGGGGDDDDLRR